MGSFANSLHVKSDQATAVIASIRHLLLADGYEISDEKPPEDALWGMPSVYRAIHVSLAREGWVSLLDSDLMNSLSLTAALSNELATHAIQVLVNDSDSWHYQLYHAGQQVDEFDSSGGEECADDEGGPALAGMFGGGDIGDLQAMMERARRLQEQMQQTMPPEIRDIQQRMQTHRAAPEEILKYSQWMGAEMPRLMETFKDLMGGFSPGLAGHLGRAADREDVLTHLQPHLEHLRPLLKAGVDDEQVLKVLSDRAVFAEETLGDFLPLLGIAPFYTNLSYRYLGECTPRDLQREGIHLAEHLKFKQSDRPGRDQLRLVR